MLLSCHLLLGLNSSWQIHHISFNIDNDLAKRGNSNAFYLPYTPCACHRWSVHSLSYDFNNHVCFCLSIRSSKPSIFQQRTAESQWYIYSQANVGKTQDWSLCTILYQPKRLHLVVMHNLIASIIMSAVSGHPESKSQLVDISGHADVEQSISRCLSRC